MGLTAGIVGCLRGGEHAAALGADTPEGRELGLPVSSIDFRRLAGTGES